MFNPLTVKAQQFLDHFERCDITPEQFDHEAHIYMAYLYFKRYPLLKALSKIDHGLLKLTSHFNACHRYHKTMTLAFSLLIYERLMQQPSISFREFKQVNNDLFCKKPDPLSVFYGQDLTTQKRLRHTFHLPLNAD